ncbi:MAG: HTH domain-containing protein [Bacteroidales bacterium]|nr:HTH domain-containing protein [Bacteroidales bacterium]
MPTAWGNHPENHVENHPENQKSSQKGSQKSSQKGSQKSSQKILALLLKDSQITTQEIANELGISRRAVAKQITNLRKKGLISRIGSDKGGYWQVNDNVDTKML